MLLHHRLKRHTFKAPVSRTMKRQLTWIIIGTMALMACEPSLQVERIYDEETGQLSAELRRNPTTGQLHGPYRYYHPNGKVMEEGQYLQGKLHGTRRLYYESGQLEAEEHIVEGKYEGPYRSWYSTGQLEMEGQYHGNEMSGVWTRYYKNGAIMERVTFAHNLENGPFKEFWPNGQLKAEGQYLNGDFEHGLLKLYNEQGQLIKKMDCKRGICRTIWTAKQGDIYDPHLDSLQRRLEQLEMQSPHSPTQTPGQ